MTKMYKQVKKNGSIVEFPRQKETTLSRWIEGRIRRNGKNITRDAYALFIKVTMPGRISQTKEGVTEGNTVTFEISDLSQSHEFAVFSDANSVGVIIGVIAVLAIVFAGVFFFTRKRG